MRGASRPRSSCWLRSPISNHSFVCNSPLCLTDPLSFELDVGRGSTLFTDALMDRDECSLDIFDGNVEEQVEVL